jgi:hypothetical protein
VDTSSPAITDTRIVAAEPGWFRHPARVETGRLHLVRSYVRAACENPLTWTFDGELVGMLVVLGPESGHVRVRAGGREEDVALWDVDCHYQRMNVVLLRRRVPADAAMTLELIDRPVDRSACKRPLPDDLETDLRLIGFLVYG